MVATAGGLHGKGGDALAAGTFPTPPNQRDAHGRESHESLDTKTVDSQSKIADERPRWQTAQTLDQYWNNRNTFFTNDQRADAWKTTANVLKSYSDEMIARWNKEIDTLLVYAGLFSAILTAFNVQSYQLLTPSPPDPVLVALERISGQLSSFSLNPPFVNSTHPAFSNRDPALIPAPRSAVWLNTLWFSSLICSLSSATVGLMVKQWLNEYSSGMSGTLRQTARLRQLRMNSLKRWHVKEIVGVLPVLLQIAAALFFGGLLVLLWTLDHEVAMVGSALVGILAVFSVFTIVLPTITTHCAYLSPPSLALLALSRPFRAPAYAVFHTLGVFFATLFHIPTKRRTTKENGAEVWVRFPWRRSWTLIHASQHLVEAGLKWRGREIALLSRWRQQLDADMIASAYTTTMDTSYLSVAATCMTELGCNAITRCFEAIRLANVAHWGVEHVQSMRDSTPPLAWSAVILAHMGVRPTDPSFDSSPATVAAALDTAYEYLFTYNPRVEQWDTPLTRLVIADLGSIVYHYDIRRLPAHFYNIGESLLRKQLQWLMDRTSGKHIGNDIRHHVASSCTQVALRGLTHGNTTWSALDALECVILCMPSPASSDYMPDNQEYQGIQSDVVRSLEALSEFLSKPRAVEFRRAIEEVFHTIRFRNHGDQATQFTPKVVNAMVHYVDLYKKKHNGTVERFMEGNINWIRRIKHDLDNPVQGANASPSLPSVDADGFLQIDTSTLAASDSVISAPVPQLFLGCRDVDSETKAPLSPSSFTSTSASSSSCARP